MTSSERRPNRSDHLDADRDLDLRLAGYLRDAPERAPAHLLGAAAVRVHATPQRRRRWRLGGTPSSWAVVAAVVGIAVIASLRFAIAPDSAVPGSNVPTTALVPIGPGRAPVVLERIGTSTIVRTVFVIDGMAWAVLVDGLVLQIDPATGEILTDLNAELDEPTGAAAGAGAVWVGSADGELVRIDVASARVATKVTVGLPHHAVAASDTAVWVAGTSGARRIDAVTLAVTEFDLPPGVVELAAVGDEVWATYASGEIVIADGATAAVRATLGATPQTGSQPGGLMVVGADDVWVTGTGDDAIVRRIDRARAEIVDLVRFEGSGRPSALALDGGTLWVLFDDGVLAQLDRDSLAVVDTIAVGLGARAIGPLSNGLAIWGASGIQVLERRVGA